MSDNSSQLLKEAMEAQGRSRMMRDNAVWISEQIAKHIAKYNDAYLAVITWEEREKAYGILKELEGRLLGSVRDLVKFDGEWRRLAERVNKEYGRKVILVGEPLTFEGLMKKWQDEMGDGDVC